MLSLEAKVGAFVVTGLALMGIAIFLLGDYTLEHRYTIYATFHDVANLNKNAPVKLSGVEVGQVKDIDLKDGLARVTLAVRKGTVIYHTGGHGEADFLIGSTGIIGSKYLQIDQGNPAFGEVKAEETVIGTDPVDIQKALTRVVDSLTTLLNDVNKEGPRGSLASNLKETVANMREMTANLNDLIETTKPNMEKAMARADQITDKLDKLLAQSNQMMTGLSTDKGAIGALLHDEKVKNDVKETVASVKEAAATAKDVFGRITQFRVFWNYDWRYDGLIRGSHSDAGLKIYPREGRYYYAGISNAANVSDANRRGTDFTQPNRVDGLMGWERGPFDVAVGAIRSAGGARVTLTPFYKDSFGKRFSVVAQAYDFGRNRTINSRKFTHPEYDFGIMGRINKWFGVGGRVEDVQETKRGMVWGNVTFEDQDIAYLFGMATFGAAGTKGRSKSGSSSGQ